MGNLLIDLLKKSRFKISRDNPQGYYSTAKITRGDGAAQVSFGSQQQNDILPGSSIQSAQSNTTTTTSTTTTTTTEEPTTTTTSTTTTTTTLPPGVYAYEMKYSVVSSDDACLEVSTSTYYSDSQTLNNGSAIFTDVLLSTLPPAGFYCIAEGCPNDLNKSWIRTNGAAIIDSSTC